MIMTRGKKEIAPVLLKFGVAVVLSFAGLLYTRFRTKRINPSPPSSGDDDGVESEEKSGVKDDLRGLQIIPSCCDDESENYEEARNPKATFDAPVVKFSPNSKLSGDKDTYLLPEFGDLLKEFGSDLPHAKVSQRNDIQAPNLDVEDPKAFKMVCKDHDQEIGHLRNVVKILRERERCLEIQLLEYYGLKEQETAVMELQNRLKVNNMEAKLFTLKIESLQTDNRRLEAQLADHAKVLAELEAARAKVKSLKKKLRYDAEQNKEQILILQRRVASLQDQGQVVSDNSPDMQLQLPRLKALEDEAEELRESNMRLQVENSELAQRLESTQILATSVLEDPEAEEMREENHHLKQENECLAHEIERLQADRCSDVEELVYLRWLNACLRYELRNYQPQPSRTIARDLSKSLSPKSEEKAKQLILEYANTEGMEERGPGIPDFDSDRWSSSQASYLTDSGEPDEASIENSLSATRTKASSKMKFFTKLRRLVRGKDRHRHNKDSCSSPDEMRVTSLQCSSSVSTDAPSNQFTSPTRGSSRLSLDIQRPSSEKCRRNSDGDSLPAYKKFDSSEVGDPPSPREKLLADQKSELVKFAEALKGTRGDVRKLRRKSASFGSY